MTFFRIGCYALLITGLVHLSGFLVEPVPADETEKQLYDLMTNYQVDVGTGTITMEDIQTGFSLTFSVLLLWTGVLGLFLVKHLAQNPLTLRKIALIYSGGLVIETAISVIFFFIVPTAFLVLCLIFFAIAVLRIK